MTILCVFYCRSVCLLQAQKLSVNNMELLNDAGSEYTSGTKLHFKIRMRGKDYPGTRT
jgi:hypothetical protein